MEPMQCKPVNSKENTMHIKKTPVELAKTLLLGEALWHWDEMLLYKEGEFREYDSDSDHNPVIRILTRKEVFQQLRAGMWAD
jgi:hypothetical protein